jgi:hypothetical protein
MTPFIRIMITCFSVGGDIRTHHKKICRILRPKDGGVRIYPIFPQSSKPHFKKWGIEKFKRPCTVFIPAVNGSALSGGLFL